MRGIWQCAERNDGLIMLLRYRAPANCPFCGSKCVTYVWGSLATRRNQFSLCSLHDRQPRLGDTTRDNLIGTFTAKLNTMSTAVGICNAYAVGLIE